jgi:nucleotide-binding universal stress UspA family protein
MIRSRSAESLNRLLVATDLSARAERAIARAIQAADEHGAALTVLHVLTTRAAKEAGSEEAVVKIEKDLRRRIGDLSPRCAKEAKVRIVSGTPHVEVIGHARKEASDIILVGAHGAQFVKDLLFGTTAEKIVRSGDCPVWIVKRPVRGRYRRVLVATDFSEQSGRALTLAMRIAPGAKCHLLHVYQGFEEQLWRAGVPKAKILRYRHQLALQSREQMKVFMDRLGLSARSVIRLLRYGRARHVIVETVRRLRPDLVCLGSEGKTGLPYIFLGSVAESALREVSCDVLVARSEPIRSELS